MNTQTITHIGHFFLASLFLLGCNVPIKDKVKESTSSVSGGDVQFIVKAASGGMMNVELGDIAQRSRNDEVKKIGQMMVADHEKANTDLKNIANDKRIILPDSMSEDDQQSVNELLKKTGSDFDKAYIDMMVDDHIKDIELLKKEGGEGKEADIRSFASGTIPVCEKHLDAARSAQKIVAGM